MLNRYEDADSKRWYDTPIGKLVSTTTVTGLISKPYLTPAAVKVTGQKMRDALVGIKGGLIPVESLTVKEIDRLVKEAKGQYRKDWDKSGDIGSFIHSKIELYYHLKMGFIVSGKIPPIEKNEALAWDAFRSWDSDNEVVPIRVEERVWSKEKFAGTLDLYAKVREYLSLVDFKTSKQHDDDINIMQLGSYDLSYRERTGNKIEKYFVVRLDKETGIPDPREYSREEVELGCKRFLAVLEYFWLTEQGKKND
jgi:hypothetical protein